MLFGLIGRVTSANQIKQGLDVGSQRTRQIAARVSAATLQNADGFALPAANAAPGSTGAGEGVDVESEMVSLADEQLRYEATARLLQKTYQQLRTSIRDR
jgi:flagellar basal body rod protein FlgB